MQSEVVRSDYVVVGSGIAGLVFSLLSADHGSVQLVTKKSSFESSTNNAQGGIACVLSEHDSFQSHIDDTLRTGCGLSKEDVVRILVEEGPPMVRRLMEWGAQFTRDPKTGELDLGREGGHSERRIVHAEDLTGREVERALLETLRRKEQVSLHENHLVLRLLVEGSGPDRRCIGVEVFDVERKSIVHAIAPAVILATGGIGQVYLHTTNPDIATGDGLAMAYRQGVPIANMEFVQFHPTSFYNPDGETFLISEAVRGEGAILKTRDGTPFMDKYDERGNLAPRDVVAQAIDNEMKKSGAPHVLLDMVHIGKTEIDERFPNITRLCLDHGIDPREKPIPVVPAAHYSCGGIVTGTEGQTALKGLFATGEVSCTGVHGANRLASNSLLEALVFSRRASEHLVEHPLPAPDDKAVEKILKECDYRLADESFEAVRISHCRDEIRRVMWDYVGIVRNDDRLWLAERRVELVRKEVQDYIRSGLLSRELVELWNLADAAWLVVHSALIRKESRGLHYNSDHPDMDNGNWRQDTVLRKPI